MQASYLDYVRKARETWAEGYDYVAAKLNTVLGKHGVSIAAPDPLPELRFKHFRRRFLNALVGLRPFVVELPHDSEVAPWSLGYVNGRENPILAIGIGGLDTDESIEEVLRFLDARDWSQDRWQRDVVGGVESFSSIWLTFFEGMEAESSELPRPPQSIPADPVTIKDMAALAHISEDAVRNWSTLDRPGPSIGHRGRQAAVFSYAAIRPWFISKRADLSAFWPESFKEAMQALDERV